MLKFPAGSPYLARNSTHLMLPVNEEDIQQWIEALKRSDRSLYNIMAMESWSIAKTMDDLFPGFWNRFMANRHQAMEQFKKQKALLRLQAKATDSLENQEQET